MTRAAWAAAGAPRCFRLINHVQWRQTEWELGGEWLSGGDERVAVGVGLGSGGVGELGGCATATAAGGGGGEGAREAAGGERGGGVS